VSKPDRGQHWPDTLETSIFLEFRILLPKKYLQELFFCFEMTIMLDLIPRTL